MFGESPMFGQEQLTVHDKGRIFIPVSTKVEKDDELVLLYNKDLNFYEIYSVSKLEEKYKELESLILNSKTKKDENFYKKRLYELSKSILISKKVDAQRRFATGKIFEESEILLITGAYDRLIIEPIKNKK